MKILVTGTPGVGKTTLAKRLSQDKGIPHIDITAFVKENKLHEQYDEKLDSLVFDEERVIKALQESTRDMESFIIDTHSPIVAEGMHFDFIFHVVCDTGEIARRLAERKYSSHKIEKNIENEIFNAIGEELDELFELEAHKINGSSIPNEDADYTFDDLYAIIQ